MKLPELYDLVFTELKVKRKNKIKRIDDFRHATARMIFCKIAKNMRYDSFEIGQFISVDFNIVNRVLREFNRIEMEDDFISVLIIERYREIVDKIKLK